MNTAISAVARAKAAIKRYSLARQHQRFGSYPFKADHFVVMPKGLLGFRSCQVRQAIAGLINTASPDFSRLSASFDGEAANPEGGI